MFHPHLRRPGIDSEDSIPPAYVAWRAGTTNRVVVLSVLKSSVSDPVCNFICLILVPMVERKRFVDEEGGDAAVFAVVGVGDGAAPTSRLSKLRLRDPTPFR